jgi:hypothetical protein
VTQGWPVRPAAHPERIKGRRPPRRTGKAARKCRAAPRYVCCPSSRGAATGQRTATVLPVLDGPFSASGSLGGRRRGCPRHPSVTDLRSRSPGDFGRHDWRRGWDSNPRYGCPHNGFRDRPIRPLWHLSEHRRVERGGPYRWRRSVTSQAAPRPPRVFCRRRLAAAAKAHTSPPPGLLDRKVFIPIVRPPRLSPSGRRTHSGMACNGFAAEQAAEARI